MRIQTKDCSVSFNIWNSRRTWFWSLVYPDRQGGAIGAAASEAEAVGEAEAAIERFPDLHPDAANTCRTHSGSSFARPFDNFNSSHAFIGYKVDAPARDLKCLPASSAGRVKMPGIGNNYCDLWQLTLQRFAEWVTTT